MKRNAVISLLLLPVADWQYYTDDAEQAPRRLQTLCAFNQACCRADLSQCKVCKPGTDCLSSDAVYQGTFPDATLTESCNGWGSCNVQTVNCNDNNLFVQTNACPAEKIVSRESGISTWIADASVGVQRDLTVFGGWGFICKTQACKVQYSSGVDQTACFTNVDTLTALTDIDTSDSYPCLQMGTGVYKVACTADNSQWTESTCTFKLTINDFCGPPNTITPQTYSNLKYMQYLDNDYKSLQASLTSFITIGNTASCAFTKCKIVSADSTTKVCNGADGTWFTAAMNVADPTKVDLKTFTKNLQALSWFCLACETNDLVPSWKYSNAFSNEIIPIDCSPYITFTKTNIGTSFAKIVPGTLSTPTRQSLFTNNYASTTKTYECPLTYELWDDNSGSPVKYTGTWIQVDSNGNVSYDEKTLNKNGLNLKVRVKSNGNYVADSNLFFVNNQCTAYTAGTIATPWTHYHPATPPGGYETVFDASGKFTGGGSDLSICSPTYSILQSASVYTGSFVKLSGASTLQVDVDTKKKESNLAIRLSLPDGNQVDSNTFEVEAKCANTGYTITNHASLVQTVTHLVPVPTTEPTFPLNAFTYPQNLCKAMTYDFFDAKSGGNSPPAVPSPGLTPGSVGAVLTPSTAIKAVDWSKVQNYPFYIRVTLEGGQQIWANIGGNEVFNLNVACGPASTAVTETSFCCSLANTQYWDKNSGNCYVLPAYTNSNPACPIQTNTTSDQSGSIVTFPSGWLQDPTWDATRGRDIVCPQDDSLDQVWEFYVRHAALGGHEHYTVKYKWVHGCPASVATYTQGAAFKTNVVKYIGESAADIWEFNGTVTPYPSCQFEKFEIIDLKYKNAPSARGVSKATSCGGADPCRFVDLDYNNHVHDVTFRIKITMTSNNIAYSNMVTIQVRCNANSASLFSTVNVPTSINVIQDERKDFAFSHFFCSPYDCCVNAYYVITTDNVRLLGSPDLRYGTPREDTNSGSQTYGQQTLQLYSGQRGTHVIYIQFKTLFGGYIYSAPITVNVKYNCKYAWIDFSHNPIKASENAPVEEVLLENNTRNDNENLEMRIDSTKYGSLTVNVTQRFISNASEWCPINYFEIYKLVDVATGLTILPKDFDDRIMMYSDGRMNMRKMNTAYAVRVYANVSNGQVWLQDTDPFMYVEIYEPWRELPNFPPYFDGNLLNLYINKTLDPRGENVFVVQLPVVKDSVSNDTFQIIVQNQPDWMQVDNEKRKLVIYKDKVSDSELASKVWHIILQDQKGDFRTYATSIGFYKDTWVPYVPAIVPIEKAVDESHNVTAYIHSISVYGELEVRFNASMFTNFNFSILTPELLDIYLEPSYSLPVDFNMSSINFTWNLTYYKDRVMRFKLHWNDPDAISPEVIQDNIVFNLKKKTAAFFSPQVAEFLHDKYWTLRHRVRRQLNDDWRVWTELVEKKQMALTGALIFSYIMNHFRGTGNFRYFFWYLRAQHYVAHFPMFHVVFPANAMWYFEMIFPIVTFNLLPREYLAFVPFSFDMPKQREFLVKSMHDQSEDLGYDSFNAVLILGTIWLLVIIYIARVAAYFGSKFVIAAWNRCVRNPSSAKHEGGDSSVTKIMKPMYTKVNGKIVKYFVTEYRNSGIANSNANKKVRFKVPQSRADLCLHGLQRCCGQIGALLCYLPGLCWSLLKAWWRKWRQHLFYWVILAILFEPYMEWCAAGIFNSRLSTSTFAGDIVGNVTGYVCMAVAFSLIPCLLVYVFVSRGKEKYGGEFQRKWSFLFQNVGQHRTIHHWFYAFYIGRRLQFFWFAFDLTAYPSLQIVLMLYQCLFFHWYVGTRPAAGKWLNRLLYLEEIIILAVVLHLTVFTDWGHPTQSARVGWGWSLIIIVTLHFMVVSLYMAVLFVDYLRLLYIRYIAQVKVWCVEVFGWRVSYDFKKKFGINNRNRVVEQMMDLEENKNTESIVQMARQQLEEAESKAENVIVAQYLNHLPHMIDRFKSTPDPRDVMQRLDQRGSQMGYNGKQPGKRTPRFQGDSEQSNASEEERKSEQSPASQHEEAQYFHDLSRGSIVASKPIVARTKNNPILRSHASNNIYSTATRETAEGQQAEEEKEQQPTAERVDYASFIQKPFGKFQLDPVKKQTVDEIIAEELRSMVESRYQSASRSASKFSFGGAKEPGEQLRAELGQQWSLLNANINNSLNRESPLDQKSNSHSGPNIQREGVTPAGTGEKRYETSHLDRLHGKKKNLNHNLNRYF